MRKKIYLLTSVDSPSPSYIIVTQDPFEFGATIPKDRLPKWFCTKEEKIAAMLSDDVGVIFFNTGSSRYIPTFI